MIQTLELAPKYTLRANYKRSEKTLEKSRCMGQNEKDRGLEGFKMLKDKRFWIGLAIGLIVSFLILINNMFIEQHNNCLLHHILDWLNPGLIGMLGMSTALFWL